MDNNFCALKAVGLGAEAYIAQFAACLDDDEAAPPVNLALIASVLFDAHGVGVSDGRDHARSLDRKEDYMIRIRV